MWGIKWTSNKDPPAILLLGGGGLNDVTQQAIKEQTEIGWDKLR